MKERTPEEIKAIASILTSWEKSPGQAYDDRFDGILDLESGADGKRGDIVVISDLHIGSGLDPSENFTGHEHFFADAAMGRFLTAVNEKRLEIAASAETAAPMTLIINGDFIDFLIITDYPDSPKDLSEWLQALQIVGINDYQNTSALNATIAIERKENYGLKTNEFKSVWKLHASSRGHVKMFEALSDWLIDGHKIVLTKGNHDLELFWPAVRNYMRFLLADNVEWKTGMKIENALNDVVLPRVTFIDNAFIMDETLYVEHGHLYDKMTRLDPPCKRKFNDEELNYPLGSFFNRYLINKINLRYPNFENVHPSESLLPLIIKTDFPLAIKIFFRYIPFLIRSIKRKQAWKIFRQTIYFGLALIAGLVVIGIAVAQAFGPEIGGLFSGGGSQSSTIGGSIEKYLISFTEGIAGLVLTYYLGRLLSIVQISEPGSLYSITAKIFHDHPNVQIVTLGHTHNPEQFIQQGSMKNGGDRWYYNTGTWIPIIDTTTGVPREDKTYTYLYFTHDASGRIMPHPLHRWDDSASRGETLTLLEIKEG